MIEILSGVEKATEDFPADGGLCSSNVDPAPLVKYARQIKRGMRFCQISLNYFEKPHDDTWLEEGVQKRTQRWKHYKLEQWFAFCDRLMRFMVGKQDILNVEYEDVHPTMEEVLTGRRFNLLVMSYILHAHLLMCTFASMSVQQRRQYTRPASEGNEYVQRHKLSLHDGPVSQYTVKQQLDTVRWLAACYRSLPYDPLLVHYLLQLEFQTARLMLYVSSSLVHNEEKYRKEMDSRLYAPTDALIRTHCAISIDMHTELFTALEIPARPADEMPPVQPEISRALRKWFCKLADPKKTKARMPSDWLREQYIAASLWPGERETYKMEHPHDHTATTMAILKKNRVQTAEAATAIGNENSALFKGHRPFDYAQLIKSVDQSPLDVIFNTLSAEPSAPESLLLQLALLEVFSLELHKRFRVDFFEYAVIARDVDAQMQGIQQEPERPRLVQLFHEFQFCFRRQVFWYKSFIESLCAFFCLIQHPRPAPAAAGVTLKPFHLSAVVSIEELAWEIFGEVPECRDAWWPDKRRLPPNAPPPPSDDEAEEEEPKKSKSATVVKPPKYSF